MNAATTRLASLSLETNMTVLLERGETARVSAIAVRSNRDTANEFDLPDLA